jgi:hypothetical protein
MYEGVHACASEAYAAPYVRVLSGRLLSLTAPLLSARTACTVYLYVRAKCVRIHGVRSAEKPESTLIPQVVVVVVVVTVW